MGLWKEVPMPWETGHDGVPKSNGTCAGSWAPGARLVCGRSIGSGKRSRERCGDATSVVTLRKIGWGWMM